MVVDFDKNRPRIRAGMGDPRFCSSDSRKNFKRLQQLNGKREAWRYH